MKELRLVTLYKKNCLGHYAIKKAMPAPVNT